MKKPTLLLIDIQKGFADPSWGRRNNPELEANVSHLLESWRHLALPVIHVQHLSSKATSPLRPGQSGCDFMRAAEPRPGEPIVQKRVHSAFIGTPLESMLKELAPSDVVIAGIATDHCVSTTARMGANLGFPMTVLSDVTATFDRGVDRAEDVHRISLASLSGEFARILSMQELLAAQRERA